MEVRYLKMEDYLIKFGIKTGHLITGLIAGAMSLVFSQRPRNLREKVRSYFIVIFGSLATAYITPVIVLKWIWLQSVDYSVAFVVGLFGMGLIESIFALLYKFKNNPLAVGKAIKDFFIK